MKHLTLILGLSATFAGVSCSQGQDGATTSAASAYEKPNASFSIAKGTADDKTFFEDAYLVNVNFEGEQFQLYSKTLKVDTKEITETEKIQVDGQTAYVVAGIQFSLEGKFVPELPLQVSTSSSNDENNSEELTKSQIEKLVKDSSYLCVSAGFTLTNTSVAAFCDYNSRSPEKDELPSEADIKSESEQNSKNTDSDKEVDEDEETDKDTSRRQGEESSEVDDSESLIDIENSDLF